MDGTKKAAALTLSLRIQHRLHRHLDRSRCIITSCSSSSSCNRLRPEGKERGDRGPAGYCHHPSDLPKSPRSCHHLRRCLLRISNNLRWNYFFNSSELQLQEHLLHQLFHSSLSYNNNNSIHRMRRVPIRSNYYYFVNQSNFSILPRLILAHRRSSWQQHPQLLPRRRQFYPIIRRQHSVLNDDHVPPLPINYFPTSTLPPHPLPLIIIVLIIITV